MDKLEMHELNVQEMKCVNGGDRCDDAEKFIATVGLIAGIASSFGPIGLAIAGPTALGMGVAAVACAYT